MCLSREKQNKAKDTNAWKKNPSILLQTELEKARFNIPVQHFDTRQGIKNSILAAAQRHRPHVSVLSHLSSAGESYQNMDATEGGYQGSSSQPVSRDFWETFGSNNSLKAKKSPSSDSWTMADNSAKKSSDSWDNWGSEVASNNKHSTEESWEAWDNNWENAEGKTKKSPTKPAEESWDNADW